jgi:RsiW-degrading membrane proteinase PrsW (M82 family)
VSLTGALVLLASMVVSTGLLLMVVAFVWFLDRYDREPLHMVAAVFLWGASAAPAISIFALTTLDRIWLGTAGNISPLFFTGVATPLIEETAKAIGVLLVVLLTRDFDNPADGFVYGTAVGLGFAVTENAIYGIGIGTTMGVGDLLILVIGRTFLAAGVHGLASATFGGFLGHAVLTRRRWQRVAWVSTGLFAATGLHGGWNVTLTLVGPFAPGGGLRGWLVILPVLYAGYILILAGFLHSEHTILKRQLTEEVALSLAPAWVVDVIPYYRRRLQSDWWPLRNERTVISRLLTRIAFRKHALRNIPRPEAAIASLEVVRLRQRLRGILTPTPTDEN